MKQRLHIPGEFISSSVLFLLLSYVTVRIVKHYINFHLNANTNWKPDQITRNTPIDIITFIEEKCVVQKKKVSLLSISCKLYLFQLLLSFLLLFQLGQHLVFFYSKLRPSEKVSDWYIEGDIW